MYTVTVNKNEPINIEPQQINWDIIEFSERKFHILQGRRSYEAVVTEANFDDKCFTIKINNNYYEVSIKDEFDRLAALTQNGLIHLKIHPIEPTTNVTARN